MDSLSVQDMNFMGLAMEHARQSVAQGEVPVGAVVVCDGAVVAAAGNAPVSLVDPTAHAEIRALREAAIKAGAYRLPGYDLYVTLEPCMMCFGALIHARIRRLVYGASDPKVGFSAHYQRLRQEAWFNHDLEITAGVRAEESGELLRSFFRSRR